MNSVQVCLFGRFFLFLLWEPAWKLHSRGPNSHSTFKSILSPLLLTFSLKYASIFSFLLALSPCVRLRVSNGHMGWPPTHKQTDSAPSQQQLALHYCAYLLVLVCVCASLGFLLLLLLRHSAAIRELSKCLSNLSAPIIQSPKQKAFLAERKQSPDQRVHSLPQNTVKLIMQADYESCWPLLAF